MYTAEYSVNGFKSLHLKESVLADGPLSLPGVNAGASRAILVKNGFLNRRFAAGFDFQRPDGRSMNAGLDSGYQDPARLTAQDVCPHCKVPTYAFTVLCEGHPIKTHRCTLHGDVVPMRSVIANHA